MSPEAALCLAGSGCSVHASCPELSPVCSQTPMGLGYSWRGPEPLPHCGSGPWVMAKVPWVCLPASGCGPVPEALTHPTAEFCSPGGPTETVPGPRREEYLVLNVFAGSGLSSSGETVWDTGPSVTLSFRCCVQVQEKVNWDWSCPHCHSAVPLQKPDRLVHRPGT